MTCILVLTLLLAFLLRANGVGEQSLWYDEGFSVSLATQGWRQILLGELNLPPLYNLLLGVWVRLAGTSEFAARYLSVCCGTLVVALGGAMGALLLGRRAGAIGALFLAVSPIEVWYAQEARMYATFAALTLGSTVCLVRLVVLHGDSDRQDSLLAAPRYRQNLCDAALVRRRRKGWLWVFYALWSVAAVYTHYYAALILVAQGVWVLLCFLQERDRRFLRPWVLSQASVGLAVIPWLPVLWSQWRAANTTFWPGLLSWQSLAKGTALGFAGADLSVSPQAALKLALLAGGLAALGLVAGLLRAPSRRWMLLLALQVVVPFTILYALVHTRPKFSPRYLLQIVPALMLLAASGVASLWPRAVRRWRDLVRAGLAIVVGGGITVGSAYAATNPLRDHAFGRDDLRGTAGFLSRTVGPDEAIILLSGHIEPAFAYYYHGQEYYPVPPKLPPSPSVDDIVSLEVLDDLNRALEGRRGVWLLLWQDDVVDPNGVVTTVLGLSTTEMPVEQSFRGLKLRHYVFPSGTRLRREMFGRQALDVTIGQGDLKLVGCDLPPSPVPSGGVATILLYWQALRPVSQDYRLSLRVIDERGQELATSDARLAAHMYPTNRWRPGRLIMARHDVQLPLAMPPGEYALQARIFPCGAWSAQRVSLGRVQVARPPRQPTLAELDIARPLGVSLAELELLGYEISPPEATPGQTVYLTLFWRARARLAQSYHTAMFLGDQHWASLPLPASAAEMEPGDVMRVQYPLRLPAGAAGGTQGLSVTLEDEAGQAVAPLLRLTELTVRIGERTFEVPAGIRNPGRITLGDTVTFLGYDLERNALLAGDVLQLTLYWQAAQAMDASYTVFTHLLDGQEQIWGQVDSIPLRGSRPTTGWLPGEVLVDTYDIPVRFDAPPGQYVLEVGLYDAITGERLAAYTEDGQRLPHDRILLERIVLQ